jgi:hypothetical protein
MFSFRVFSSRMNIFFTSLSNLFTISSRLVQFILVKPGVKFPGGNHFHTERLVHLILVGPFFPPDVYAWRTG